MDLPPSETPALKSNRFSLRLIVLLVGGAILLSLGVVVSIQTIQWATAIRPSNPAPDRVGRNAPFIVTPDPIVEKMVEVAELTPADVVYDLGCGDGRIVITAAVKSGCHGVGFEIDPERVSEARENVRRHGVEHLVEIRQQDVFTVNMHEASVVMMYLLPWMTKKLIPQFEDLQDGSRIVSHDFGLGDIKHVPPDLTVKVPSDTQDSSVHLVHKWVTPLRIPAAK